MYRGATAPPSFAFAFDIDGVLIRGPQPLPAAKRALAMLDGANPWGMCLTNGGGSSEEDRCQKLTAQLGVDIKPSQFIQAHTILKSVVKNYADVPVLVLGGRGGEIREVAEKYGFKKAYTTLDVLAWNPAVWPFHELTPDERQSTKPVDFSETPISAIFVFHDPRNWALDIQIICDVVHSGGMMCIPDEVTACKTRPVELVFCNPDIIWRSDFERPRIGQGAFREAFQAVYKALTGSEYPHVQYGKPTQATYRFAEKVLRDRCKCSTHNQYLVRTSLLMDNC
ncbi:Haloacid dehalogenase-like hydrolase-domain-containing protein [Amylocystis lapponica]|nr:Haloacid dehalogenase-like hydrolase-domain-containing protein [Amylocystis lapponica]